MGIVVGTGVPGLPGIAGLELAVISLWLAFGRSAVLQGENHA
jgi:hypothetical protein